MRRAHLAAKSRWLAANLDLAQSSERDFEFAFPFFALKTTFLAFILSSAVSFRDFAKKWVLAILAIHPLSKSRLAAPHFALDGFLDMVRSQAARVGITMKDDCRE